MAAHSRTVHKVTVVLNEKLVLQTTTTQRGKHKETVNEGSEYPLYAISELMKFLRRQGYKEYQDLHTYTFIMDTQE